MLILLVACIIITINFYIMLQCTNRFIGSYIVYKFSSLKLNYKLDIKLAHNKKKTSPELGQVLV